MVSSSRAQAGAQVEGSRPSLAGRRILVTGVAGFIGFHVAGRALENGATVLGIDSLNAYYDLSLKHARLAELRRRYDLTFVKLDLSCGREFQDCMAAFKPEVVIHLAAQAGVRYSLEQPEAYISNVSGFLSILEGCRQHPVDHLIYASSSSVYGMNRKLPFSEHDRVDHPVSLYAATKRANELMAHTYAHLFGVCSTGLRFFTVYGPWGRPDMAYFKFTRAIEAGEPIDVYNHGQLERDFTYVDDVTDAILHLIDKPPNADPSANVARPDPAISAAPTRIFNVGNNHPIPLDRMIGAIEAALKRTAKRRLLPMQPGDVTQTYADIEDLKAVVGFAPSVSIEQGIQQFVSWYRGFYPELGQQNSPRLSERQSWSL